jgi:hypothetical protein
MLYFLAQRTIQSETLQKERKFSVLWKYFDHKTPESDSDDFLKTDGLIIRVQLFLLESLNHNTST